MKAIIAAVLLNVAPLTSPPPLVPLGPMPDPVEETTPLYARQWLWVLFGGATVQTVVFGILLGFALFRPAPIPTGIE